MLNQGDNEATVDFLIIEGRLVGIKQLLLLVRQNLRLSEKGEEHDIHSPAVWQIKQPHKTTGPHPR